MTLSAKHTSTFVFQAKKDIITTKNIKDFYVNWLRIYERIKGLFSRA